jgi:hypothetical protein
MHEACPTARIESGDQKGGRFFGDLNTNKRRRSICRRFILVRRAWREARHRQDALFEFHSRFNRPQHSSSAAPNMPLKRLNVSSGSLKNPKQGSSGIGGKDNFCGAAS